MRNQLDILYDIQKKGFNVVTCGECGVVVLHDIEQEEIECYECGMKSEPCDFPDFFYEGWDYKKKEKGKRCMLCNSKDISYDKEDTIITCNNCNEIYEEE